MSAGTIYAKHAPVFVLWACRETGVLEALRSGPTDAGELATAAGITERAADISLSALASLGYAECDGETYRATEDLDAFDPETPVTEKGILPHRIDSLENYIELPERMRTGEYPDASERELRNYVGGMAVIGDGAVRAGVTAAEHAHPRPQRVLDVGGGIGRFSREFARRGAAVTLFDAPAVIDIVRPHLDEPAVDPVAGDALESLPSGFDLAFCGRLTVSFSPTENRRLFENVYEALEPGGTIACFEYVRGRSDVADLFGFHMLTLSETGNTYTQEQYRTWLDGAGFVETTVDGVPGTDFQMIVGHKPP
jgi:SAM-dependent methyltransferase